MRYLILDYFKSVAHTYINFVQSLWKQNKSKNDNSYLDAEFVNENLLSPL